jgi:hypothetical protein
MRGGTLLSATGAVVLAMTGIAIASRSTPSSNVN